MASAQNAAISPSLSLSLTRRRNSLISLDEFEATDNKHGLLSFPQSAHASLHMPGPHQPISSTQHSHSPDYHLSHTAHHDTVPLFDVVSPALPQPASHPLSRSQPHTAGLWAGLFGNVNREQLVQNNRKPWPLFKRLSHRCVPFFQRAPSV